MVHIRRTIGHKQDTIHVNKKLMKRGALLSLLESAGFSRRNPYYIVQQGGIQRMALCSNETRLALVKDLAGIADFESRKEEAIKKLRNWEMEKEEVDNRVEEIEKDFQKLKAEGQELKLFMKLEKQKQTLVKVLSLRRANDVDKKLEEIQPIKAALALKKMEAVQVLEVAQADLNEAQAYLQRSVKELEDKTCTRDVLREEIDDLIENEAKLNVQLSALKREIGEREHSERGSKEELQGLKEKLFAKENELKTKSRELKKATEECQWKELEIAKLRQAQKLHYSSKAWDSDNFRSDDERQDFIQHEMTVIDEDLHDKERELEGIAEVHDKLNQVQQKLEEEIRVTRRAIDEHQTWIDNLKASAAEKVGECELLEIEADELVRKHRHLMEKRNSTETGFNEARCNCLRAKPFLKPTITGYESLAKVMQSFRNEGNMEVFHSFKGVVGSVLEIDNRCQLAASAILGSNVFNGIVTTAAKATQILKRSTQMNLPGQINLLSLDKLNPFVPEMTKKAAKSKRFLHMVSHSEEMTPVAEYYFGRYVLVQDSSIFSEYKGSKFNCITLDGEEASSRGVMKGGYYSPTKSMLPLFVEYMTSRQQLSDLKSKESDAMAQIQDTRKRLRDLLDLKEKNLTKAKLVSDKRQSLKAEERCLISRLDDLVRELETAAEAAHRQQMDRTQLESSKWMLQKSAFHLGQIDDDSGFETRSTEVLQIDMKLQELTSELQALFQVKNRIETERNQLKNDLDMNLKAKLDDLSTSLSQAQSSKDTRNEALICQSKWKLVCSRLKEAQESLKKVEHRLAKIGGIRFEIQDRVDQSKSTVSEAQGKVKALSEEFANLAAKEAKLKAVSEEEKDKIGKLAEDDVANEYAERDTKSLLQEFKKVQKEWEKYQNVNRQAIDDYLRLESEKKKFAKLLENSGQNHDRISHLLEDIEVHRKNKIHFTFNQISKYFSEIFNDLVVDGRGKMKFILRDNDPDEPLGIALKVRFCSSGDLVDLNHLSGGQKSIVAIAFIFAIQKCDPAPFYILDEADAALDSNHRHRVIQWMANQKMQFICTTFKPEFLSKADHCIGIRHSGVSSVAQIVSAQDAHNFVEQPEDDEEHPGDTPNMEH
ncbi:hypothetical protein TCAL_09748 [Tigriopus californicus]|uniref:SMC hinge domain-containing protein n=1 Tax=Tigriopus californicus TaxID=6832 RepID=A0A553PAD4_TIGCA|nr:hypothetical protein TCAL_09748 [Tigriopus californicus]